MPATLGCSSGVLIAKGVRDMAPCSGWQRLLSALCSVTAFHGNLLDLWNDVGDAPS